MLQPTQQPSQSQKTGHNLLARLEAGTPVSAWDSLISALSDSVGKTRQQVFRYLKDQNQIPATVAIEWAYLLGCTPGQLLDPDVPIEVSPDFGTQQADLAQRLGLSKYK